MNLVVQNANVYTSDVEQPRADMLVVRDGVFAFVGRADDWRAQPGEARTVVDVGGAMIMPGIVDSHAHPAWVAQSRAHVHLPWTHNVDELLAFIRQYGLDHPADELPFIYFEYYPSTLFGDDRPTKELLDTAISDRPVLCQDFSEHSSWANSQMLDLMGVTAATPDPVPGLEMFVRDADGEPTGHLLENVHLHFMDVLFDRIGWRPDETVTPEALTAFFDFMTAHGVTSVFEAVIPDEESIRAVAQLDKAEQLHVLYEGAPRFRTLADLPEALATVHRYQSLYGSDRVRVRTLKLFLDGTNESGNSAVLDPHSNDELGGNLGQIQVDTPELTEALVQCNASDVDLHIHLVGDRAFRVGCDAVEAAQSQVSGADDEWTIKVTFAHCELVDPADMGRPAQLGIVINWTPHWSAGYFGEESATYLGERWDRMYAFNEIADSGATLTFSSDVVSHYELGRGNPFFGMQVAHTRVDPQYPLDPVRFPGSVRPRAGSRLSLQTLLKGYTIDGARQLGLEHRVGSLEVGKRADFLVLSDDLFEVAPDLIGSVRPTAVVAGGRLVSGTF